MYKVFIEVEPNTYNVYVFNNPSIVENIIKAGLVFNRIVFVV